MKKITVERAAIEVFGGCNYKCTMCPQSTGRGSSWTRKMPLDHFTHLLDQLDGNPLIQLEGSGEAFLAKDLHLYVQECTNRGFKTFVKTNGTFTVESIEKVIEAGLNYIRFSIIGYDRESYNNHMSVDNYYNVVENIEICKQTIKKFNSNCEVSLYHLLTHDIQQDDEIQKYKLLSQKFGITSYVWKMHNWSGNINIQDRKLYKKRKSCGRPFAPEITIRAGGEPGRIGAVTPCTQTLGPPNELESVLGYSDEQTLYDIFNGEKYHYLKECHENNDFDKLSYCKNCDFLYDDPEVLIWTNDAKIKVGNIQGTNINLFGKNR